MARKTQHVTIEAEGRDKGKRFVIKEMPASKAEWWAYQVCTLLIANGVEMPDGFGSQGMADIAQVGLKALGKIPPTEAKPLLDEMMSCVEICPNETDPTHSRRLYEEDIEEVGTRLKLRLETLKLHTSFFTEGSA